MRNILVPTDFSENSSNSLYYAIELAKREKAKIILLHAFTISYANVFSPENDLAEAKKESDNELHKLGTSIEHAGGLDYEYVSVEGSAVKVILDTIDEKKIDLVIMGTKGERNFANAVFGSTTSKVIAKAECPVIAVPENASFEPIKKITYATNYKHGDIVALRKVLEIARPYHAQINFLHISTEEESPETERELMKKFMGEVTSRISYNNLSFQMLHGKNVEEELWKYIDSGASDLIVMASHQNGFVEGLFNQQLAKKVVSKTNVPLMVFHFSRKLAEMLF